MSEHSVEEVRVPATLDEPGAEDFIELVNLRNHIEADILGTDALGWTAAGLIPIFGNSAHRLRRHFVIRVDGRIVGRALVGWRDPTDDDAVAANIYLEVLPSHRGRGIGTALLKHAEELTASLGRPVLQTELPHTAITGGPRIASPTGFGDVAAEDPGARFLTRHAYQLEMVARVSQLDLATAGETVAAQLQLAESHAGADYRLLTWSAVTPPERYEELARLKTAMSTDAPFAGMEMTEDVWDVARVADWDIRMRATGRTLFTAAAEHVPSGRLVAYSEIGLPEGDAQPATQEDTLVLIAHRGHRLGLLTKAANLQQLVAVAPGTPVITTFNAEDNLPMLGVNVALGFRPIGLEGSWQKDLR